MSNFLEWINSKEYQELVEIMQKAQDEQMKDLEEHLTTEMLHDIRQWRVGEGPEDLNTHSWRGIATLFTEKYPVFSADHKIDHGNQISGMQLCEAAMKLLNEKTEDGWN